MIDYQNKLQDAYRATGKFGKVLWKFLSLSLADRMFSFAKVVCISVESDGIYLVYGEKALWRTAIQHYKYLPLEENQPPGPEYLASVISRFVAEFNISRTDFVLCLPRDWAIVQNAEFPLAAKENLSMVISFELDRLTPLSKDNACYDYYVLGEDLQNIRVMLVVARADQIQDYLQALQVKDIKVKRIVISSLLDDGPTSLSRQPGILIDTDEKPYNIFRDKLKSIEVSRLDKTIESGAPVQEKELSPAALGGMFDTLWPNEQSINLLSKNNHIRTRTPLSLTIALLTVILAIFAFYFLMPVYFEQQKLDEMDRRIQALKPAVKKIEVLKSEVAAIAGDIKAIDDFKTQNDLTLNIIKNITAILPPKTWLTRLRITDATVEMEGYSASSTEIILKLENSRYFQKVEFASPTFRDSRQNNERFVIKMELKNSKIKKDLKAEIKNEKKK